MNKYKIGYSMGYAGTDSEEIIEAECLEDAEEVVWDIAIQRVSVWAELIEGEEPDEDSD